MSPENIFRIQLVLSYLAWGLCFGAYIWPWLTSMERAEAQRVIATLHGFRFFGLIFILPGVVGANLPGGFTTFSAYGDLATGVLALLALLTFRMRPLFWLFVTAFNLVGITDLLVDYYDAISLNLPATAGELGGAYGITILYVPLLVITHAAAFFLWLRPATRRATA